MGGADNNLSPDGLSCRVVPGLRVKSFEQQNPTADRVAEGPLDAITPELRWSVRVDNQEVLSGVRKHHTSQVGAGPPGSQVDHVLRRKEAFSALSALGA